jgi:hypothetical protein
MKKMIIGLVTIFAVCALSTKSEAYERSWPLVNSKITSQHDIDDHVRTNGTAPKSALYKAHVGIDLVLKSGSSVDATVYATCNGTVKSAKASNGYGGIVIIECDSVGGEVDTDLLGHMYPPNTQTVLDNIRTLTGKDTLTIPTNKILRVIAGQRVVKGETVVGYVAPHEFNCVGDNLGISSSCGDARNGGTYYGYSPHIHWLTRKGAYNPRSYVCGFWFYGAYPINSTACEPMEKMREISADFKDPSALDLPPLDNQTPPLTSNTGSVMDVNGEVVEVCTRHPMPNANNDWRCPEVGDLAYDPNHICEIPGNTCLFFLAKFGSVTMNHRFKSYLQIDSNARVFHERTDLYNGRGSGANQSVYTWPYVLNPDIATHSYTMYSCLEGENGSSIPYCQSFDTHTVSQTAGGSGGGVGDTTPTELSNSEVDETVNPNSSPTNFANITYVNYDPNGSNSGQTVANMSAPFEVSGFYLCSDHPRDMGDGDFDCTNRDIRQVSDNVVYGRFSVTVNASSSGYITRLEVHDSRAVVSRFTTRGTPRRGGSSDSHGFALRNLTDGSYAIYLFISTDGGQNWGSVSGGMGVTYRDPSIPPPPPPRVECPQGITPLTSSAETIPLSSASSGASAPSTVDLSTAVGSLRSEEIELSLENSSSGRLNIYFNSESGVWMDTQTHISPVNWSGMSRISYLKFTEDLIPSNAVDIRLSLYTIESCGNTESFYVENMDYDFVVPNNCSEARRIWPNDRVADSYRTPMPGSSAEFLVRHGSHGLMFYYPSDLSLTKCAGFAGPDYPDASKRPRLIVTTLEQVSHSSGSQSMVSEETLGEGVDTEVTLVEDPTSMHIHVIGGFTAAEQTSNRVYVSSANADGSMGSWRETTPLPSPRVYHSAQRIGDYIIVISGSLYGGSNVLIGAVDIVTGAVGSWQEGSNLPEARWYGASFVYQDFVCISGGSTRSNPIGSRDTLCAHFDRDTATLNPWFTASTNLPTPMILSSAIVSGTDLILLGGWVNGDRVSGNTMKTELLVSGNELRIDTWENIPSFHGSRYHAGAAINAGNIFLVGGLANSSLRDTQCLMSDGSWLIEDDLPLTVRGNTLSSWGDKLYSIGGTVQIASATATSRTFISTVSTTGETTPWVDGPTLPQALHGHATVIGGRLVRSSQSVAREGVTSEVTPEVTPEVIPEEVTPPVAVPSINIIHLAGGIKNGGVISRDVLYSIVTPDGSLGAWSTTTPLPAPRYGHSVTRLDDYLIVAGGRDGPFERTVWVGRVETDGSVPLWNIATPLPEPRVGHSAFTYENHLCLTGGTTPTLYGGTTDTVCSVFDTATGTLGPWYQAVTAFAGPRAYHQAVRVGNSLYIMGGYYGPSVAAFRIYADVARATIAITDGKVTLSTWYTESSFATPRFDFGAVSVEDRLFLGGGVQNYASSIIGGDIQSVTNSQNGHLATWSHTLTMSTPRGGVELISTNDHIYLIGGYRDSAILGISEVLRVPVSGGAYTTDTPLPYPIRNARVTVGGLPGS